MYILGHYENKLYWEGCDGLNISIVLRVVLTHTHLIRQVRHPHEIMLRCDDVSGASVDVETIRPGTYVRVTQ